MKKVLSFLILLILATSMMAQTKTNKRAKLEAKKVEFITKKLDLSPEESAKFWPIYNAYAADKKALHKGKPKKSDIKNMSDQELEILLEGMIQIDEKKAKLKRQYFQDLKGILPIKKVVQLQFIEKRFKRKMLQHARKKGKMNKNVKQRKKEKKLH